MNRDLKCLSFNARFLKTRFSRLCRLFSFQRNPESFSTPGRKPIENQLIFCQVSPSVAGGA